MNIPKATLSEIMAELGRRGDRKKKARGGKKAARRMTPEQRIERARKAGKASAEARRKKA
jgi:hypothetical protein